MSMPPAYFMHSLIAAIPSEVTEAALFYLFATLTAAASLAVVISRNIVRMSVALLFALSGVAGIFFLLQAEFLAAVQLVVYVGGTLILIVFGIMLTSKSPFTRFEPTRAEVVVAAVFAIVLLAALVVARPAQEPLVKYPLDPDAPWSPEAVREPIAALASRVVPVVMSRTKRSRAVLSFPSTNPGTRSVARLRKAT